MKIFVAILLCLAALASPAAGADATLEGYGGDGALLVGIDSGDSPFGGADAGGRSGPRDDGNLVAEGGTPPATTQSPVAPGEAPAQSLSRDTAQENRRGEPGSRTRRDRTPKRGPSASPPGQPNSGTPPQVTLTEAPPEAESGRSAALPFTSLELALLLGGALGVLALGFAMSRMAAAAPRF